MALIRKALRPILCIEESIYEDFKEMLTFRGIRFGQYIRDRMIKEAKAWKSVRPDLMLTEEEFKKVDKKKLRKQIKKQFENIENYAATTGFSTISIEHVLAGNIENIRPRWTRIVLSRIVHDAKYGAFDVYKNW